MENKENKNKKLSQEDIEYIHSEEFINKFGDWEKANLVDNILNKERLEAVNPINRQDSSEPTKEKPGIVSSLITQGEVGLSEEQNRNLSPLITQRETELPYVYEDKRLIQICQVPQLPYMEFDAATKQWLPTKETIEAVKEDRLFVEKVGQEYQIKINDITNKSNIQGATAMNENEKSAVKKMDEELEKTILREHQEMEELEAEAAVAKAVDESVQDIAEENGSKSLLGKILDDKEKKEKENILEEENIPNNVFLLNRNDELSNEVESSAITDSVFSANESERSVYDEIPKIFEDLNTHFNESVREKENWDFRYKGIKIGEVSKDGSIKFCENKKLSELNLDLEKIKEQISLTSFAKRENFSFEENCNLGEDKREEKYVKMFEEQQKTELEKEIGSEEMNSESFAKDFAQKIQSANLEEVNSLFNNAREQNIDMSEISDFRDEKGNNVLHLAAKNPNLTPEMLTVFHKNLGAEKSTELYFGKNKEEKIPLDVSRTENFLPDKNVNFEKTFGGKKQVFDVPKPFTAMSIGSSVALEFEKNKNPDKFNVDNAAFNSVMKKSLQDQMTQRKNLIENWDFRNDSEGIAQAFENKGVSFDEKTRSNIISYDFVHFAGGEKKVLDSIKLSENKDGLSILESSNTNLTALVERNFKIEKDKNYRLFRDISNTTAFMNVPGRNKPTPNYKEFPQDYMKQNGYLPPMLVQNARNENGEKSVLVAGKDEFGNPCEYRMNETQVSNIIHNSMNYAAKNGEKVDFLKDKNVVPLSHIDFIKNHDPNADIGTAFRDSLNSFEKQHQTKVFAPFVKEQEFKQKMEQEANLEKAKKLAYEQNQTLGGMER